jgi:hypothetical protein
MSHSPGITNLPVPSITLTEVGIVTCFARPSGNVVPANEDGHVLLWLVHSWVDDGDMRERKAPQTARELSPQNTNSAQSTNSERKTELN